MALGSIYNAYPHGRPSGLPDDIVDQLVKVKQYEVLNPLEADIQSERSREDNYKSLSSKLVALYKAADELDLTLDFHARQVKSSNESVATAKASSSAHLGSYNVHVNKIAKAHNLIIGIDDSDPSTGVTLGISDYNDPDVINDSVELSFYHNGVKYSYTTESDTTLAKLAEMITEDDNGVYASVINIGTEDNPKYVLSLLSEDTGSGLNQITKDSSGTTTGVNLSGDLFSTGSVEQEDAQLGEDADFSVNGVEFSRSSNEVTDVVEGVTLNLLEAGDTQIEVSLDVSSIADKVEALINAYNQFDQFMDENATYDLEKKKGGPLLGDSIARSAQNNVRSIFSTPVPHTEDRKYQYLSQIGITFNDEGELEFDRLAFEEALRTNPEEVSYLFTGEDGIATRLKTALETYTSAGTGIIPKTIKSIESRIDKLQEKYDEAQEDLKDYEERLVKKYSNLEEMVLKYQAIQEQLDSYIEQWKNLYKS